MAHSKAPTCAFQSTHPCGVRPDAHTGMDDQIEYALIDNLAMRLAGVYGLTCPQDVALAAQSAVKGIERENTLPMYDNGDSVLNNL